MDQQQESQQKVSRKLSSSVPEQVGETGCDRSHPHEEIPTLIIGEETLEIRNPGGEAQPSIRETSRANGNVSVSPPTAKIRERIGEPDASRQQHLWNELFKYTTDDINADVEDLWKELYKLATDYNADDHMHEDLSIDAIGDLWDEYERDFGFLNDVLGLDTLVDFSTPPAQPPPSATVMPSASDTITEIDWYCWESLYDDCNTGSTNTPQEQTLPPFSTATPSELKPIADIAKYNFEMIDKGNAIASISMPQAQTRPPVNTATPSIPNTIADIGSGSMKMIDNDNPTPSINTAQAQPQPPIDTTMPSIPNTIADIGWAGLKMIHEDNVTVSINASQAQTRPQISIDMPSVPNALPHVGWDSMEMKHEDNAMANTSAAQYQTPPPVNTVIVSNMLANADRDILNIIHEDNTMTSTNTTQAQTTQPSVTAMSYVSETTGSKNESVTRSMAKVHPNSETTEITPIARQRRSIHCPQGLQKKARVRRETAAHTECRKKE